MIRQFLNYLFGRSDDIVESLGSPVGTPSAEQCAEAVKSFESLTEPPSPAAPDLQTEDYSSFSREAPWTDQGLELLNDSAALARWIKRFQPSHAFEVIPPISYPAIVIYTRVRRTGLRECEFYWDYVTPSDFTALPSARPAPNPVLEHQLASGSGLPECFVCHQILRDSASKWLVSQICPGRPVDSKPTADERTSDPNPQPASIQHKKESS
jgi:hypothetical protein